MDITPLGAISPAAATAVRPQAPAHTTQVTAPPAQSTTPAGARVRARDLLSDDEKTYLESLFPGATAEPAAEGYASRGRTAPLPPGSIVDRRG